MIETVERWLTADGWPHERDDNEFLTAFEGNTAQWNVALVVLEQDRRLICWSFCPLRVPPERVEAVSATLHKANWGLTLACFEFDGEVVRCRTGAHPVDQPFDDTLIRNTVYENVSTMDLYMPALVAVLGGAEPDEALERVEVPGPG